MPGPHDPAVTRTNTVKVKCAATGPQQYDNESQSYSYPVTLADVEGWCAELRQLGAGDELVLPEADGLVVTLDLDGT